MASRRQLQRQTMVDDSEEDEHRAANSSNNRKRYSSKPGSRPIDRKQNYAATSQKKYAEDSEYSDLSMPAAAKQRYNRADRETAAAYSSDSSISEAENVQPTRHYDRPLKITKQTAAELYHRRQHDKWNEYTEYLIKAGTKSAATSKTKANKKNEKKKEQLKAATKQPQGQVYRAAGNQQRPLRKYDDDFDAHAARQARMLADERRLRRPAGADKHFHYNDVMHADRNAIDRRFGHMKQGEMEANNRNIVRPLKHEKIDVIRTQSSQTSGDDWCCYHRSKPTTRS